MSNSSQQITLHPKSSNVFDIRFQKERKNFFNMNVTTLTHRIEEPEMTVTLATVGQAMTGAGKHIIAPEGCLTMEQGDFLPWDNPDNILSRQVRAHEYSHYLTTTPAGEDANCSGNPENAQILEPFCCPQDVI